MFSFRCCGILGINFNIKNAKAPTANRAAAVVEWLQAMQLQVVNHCPC